MHGFSSPRDSIQFDGLALCLNAFIKATLVVLCRGENGKPFCLAEF